MRQNPERLAWIVLITAFAAFCMVIVACRFSVPHYLHNARQPLHIQVTAQRGTVRVERQGSNRGEATSLDTPPLELFKGDSVHSSQLNEGLLTIQRGDENNRETLCDMVIYDNSDIYLRDAYSPRFALSSGAHVVALQIKDGRMRIQVQPAADGRPVQVNIQTDHARVQLVEGSYALEVTNQQTTITARRGQANIRAKDQELALTDGKHAIVSPEGTIDVSVQSERNLITNGDFKQGVDAGWTRLIPSGDLAANISLGEGDGEPGVRFQHTQAQHQEISLVQTINSNVRDINSLVLHLKLRINFQSLSVCGTEGTECPLMVRINYQDVNGGDRQWVHGFYIFDDPNFDDKLKSYYCYTCPAPSSGNHDIVPERAWFHYQFDLMEIDPPELRPVIINSIRVYASGHQYDSMVTDIELLAQE